MKQRYFAQEEVKRVVASGKQLPENSLVRKQFIADEIKALDAGRKRQFVISTGSVDRDNDTISPQGWHLDNFLRNPVVLFAHDYDSLPIGKATDIHMDGGKLVATAEFADHEMAETCLKLIDGGFLRATSVGFRPMKVMENQDRGGYGMDFVEQELLEFSIVPVPANPEALIIARGHGINVEPLKAWAEAITKGLTEKDVPPVSQATGPTCGACGTVMTEGVCPGCGWRSPEAEPMTHPMQMSAETLTAAVSAAVKETLAAREPELLDLRDDDQVIAVLASAADIIAKRGRVLSAANENKIRAARDAVASAQEQIDTVLAQLEKIPESDDDGKTAYIFAEEPQDAIVLTIMGDDDAMATEADVRSALAASVSELLSGLGPLIREQTQTALAKARGRVD